MKKLEIKYCYHSGFTVEIEDAILIFDYWNKKNNLNEEDLKKYNEVYVFISHSHPDHFDPIVYTWKKINIIYIISDDIPKNVPGVRMTPGEVKRINNKMLVRAFDSTDIGISFYIEYEEISIFHAGDLNLWHWKEESTPQEIEDAENKFKKIIQKLKNYKIDIAFFPADPRMGKEFDAGINYFFYTIKPTILIPMHFWEKKELIEDLSRKIKLQNKEYIPLTEKGDRLRVFYDDHNIIGKEVIKNIDQYSILNEKDDPFFDTDLPVIIEK